MKHLSKKIFLDRNNFQESGRTHRFDLDIPSTHGTDIVGIRIYEVGFKTNEYSIGFNAHNQQVQELTYKEDWTRSTELERTKELHIENINDRKVYFDIQAESVFSGDTTLHVVFLMR